MSSITAVSPSVSQHPSPTPSQSSKPAVEASSILFSFLVVFLAIFGIFMFGGIMAHHVMARRRLLVRAQIERVKQMRLKKRKPKLWEARAEKHKFADLPSKWKDVNPLSVEFELSQSEAHRRRKAEEPLHAYIQPMTFEHAIDLVRDTFARRPILPPLPDPSDELILPPTVPDTGTELQIAFLVAMPSPCPPVDPHSDISVDVELGECVIGTLRTYMDHPKTDII